MYTKNMQSNAHSGKCNNGTSLTCHMSIVLVQFWCQTVNIGKFGCACARVTQKHKSAMGYKSHTQSSYIPTL